MRSRIRRLRNGSALVVGMLAVVAVSGPQPLRPEWLDTGWSAPSINAAQASQLDVDRSSWRASETASPCARSTRDGLSRIGQAVLSAIESTPGAAENSPVAAERIVSFCNTFHGVQVDGPQIYGSVREMLSQAQHEVDMAFYQWDTDSEAAQQIGDGLIAAQQRRRPILVRILIDDVELDTNRAVNGLWDSYREWIARGMDPGLVQVQFATSSRQTFAAANMHDKYVVVDGRQLVVTGANPQIYHDSPASDDTADDPRPWHDTGYRFEGDVARSALTAFDATWRSDSARHWDCRTEDRSRDCDKLDAPDRFPDPARGWLEAAPVNAGDLPLLAVARSKGRTLPPENRTDNPQDIAWLTAMDQARKQIHVETPNINDDAFRDAVVRAVGRGVKVRLITGIGFNHGETNLPFQGGDNEQVVGDLRQRVHSSFNGAFDSFLEVGWYGRNGTEPIIGNDRARGLTCEPAEASVPCPGPTHVKYMTVDDEVAIVGSGNMETPSWNFSQEFNVLIDDAATTSVLEREVFQKDWATSIHQYVEFYEKKSGGGELVCVQAIVRDKAVRFSDTAFCDNDEAQSLVVYGAPAGRLLRLYDDANGSTEDDWTEIEVRRPGAALVVDSLEANADGAQARVTYFRNNGLGGKLSRMEVSAQAVGRSVLSFYEGEGGSQNKVCDLVDAAGTIRFKGHPSCGNDEARSVRMVGVPAGTVLRAYDDPECRARDDWSEIRVLQNVASYVVNSFERAVRDDMVDVVPHGSGLDGKVSCISVTLP